VGGGGSELCKSGLLQNLHRAFLPARVTVLSQMKSLIYFSKFQLPQRKHIFNFVSPYKVL
jgi:hypothetical protein